MHKVRNSAGATTHSRSKISEELRVAPNCTKASAVAQEEDRQPLVLNMALMTPLPTWSIRLP